MRIEFIREGYPDKHLAVTESESPPRKHEFVSIRGRFYMVVRVVWSIDYPNRLSPSTRVIVELREA